MKISIVGPAHPYRGGLAVIMQSMARVFQHRGDEVKIKTFTLQYPPYFLSRQESDGADTSAARSVHRAVRESDESVQLDRRGAVDRPRKPDFVLMKYWTPFMAPCFGTIARFAKKERYDAHPLSDRQRRSRMNAI